MAFCHALESRVQETGEVSPSDRQALLEVWRPIAALADTEGGSRATIEVGEQAEVIRALMAGAPRAEIARAIQSWSFEPVRKQLSRIGERAKSTAERLGKGAIEVIVEDNEVRLPREGWRELWAAVVHLVRNAVDHGLEPPDERVLAGKPEKPRITLRALVEDSHIVLEIADDGRGIDWEAIRARAADLGLQNATHDDLTEALFLDGLSSRVAPSEYSGRGIGMGAVRAVCADLGGTIHVQSEPGKGSRVALRVPRPDPETLS